MADKGSTIPSVFLCKTTFPQLYKLVPSSQKEIDGHMVTIDRGINIDSNDRFGTADYRLDVSKLPCCTRVGEDRRTPEQVAELLIKSKYFGVSIFPFDEYKALEKAKHDADAESKAKVKQMESDFKHRVGKLGSAYLATA
jgi:hypothetical protein